MKRIDKMKLPGWKHLLFLWMFLLPVLAWAQTGTYITWDFQVSCIDNGSEGDPKDPRANAVLWEEIENSPCIRVCEGSMVNYTVHGQNITNVQWSVSGGNLGTIGAQPALVVPVNWGNAGSGAISITITYSNGTQETASVCFEKIHSPKPEIGISGSGSSDVCLNSTIYFENLTTNNGGTNVLHYLWDFGDGTTSTLFEPSHSYSQPGTYTVTLTATNECNCSSTTDIKINVEDSNPVSISCASVVCENSKEIYTVSDTCHGDWEVIGGTIVANNGNQIEVLWDQVDPADGFGYVMYRSACGCRQWTTVKIPVILSNAKILGEQAICTQKQYTYKLPQWPTTNVLWNVSDPSVQLILTANRNEVIVKANQPGNFTLYATYTNTLLGCDGKSEINITAEEPVTINNIDTGNEICEGSSQTFSASPNIPVVWTISGSTGTVTSPLTSQPYIHQFNTPGTYTVTAVRDGGCASAPKIVKVIATPSAPSGTISGPDKVCAGVPYTYTLSAIDAGVIPVWEVTNGSVQGNNTGQSVTVIFNPAFTNYTVSVKNKTLDQIGCESSPKTYNVTKIDLNSITITPNPGGPFCPSTQQTFTANLNGITPDSMEWLFSQPNFGSFVHGQGTSTIQVNFNEISNSQDTANLILRVTKCGTTLDIPLTVKLKTLPIISFANTNNVCLGGNLEFTVTVSNLNVSAGQTANVVFTFANGSTFNAGTVTANGTYTYTFPNNGYILNNSGANITQTVIATLTGSAVCNYQPLVSANFIIYPETKITITPTFNLEICDPANYQPYTLYANASSGLTATTYYKWIQNGTTVLAQGTNLTSYTISGNTPFGEYYVEAIDVNGCTVQSQIIKVIQKCPTTDCTVSPNPNLLVNVTWSACNTISATVSYTNAPSSIKWFLNGILVQTGGTSLTSNTNVVGINTVHVEALYGTCWLSSEGAQVIKSYEPQLNFTQICNTNGTYTLTAHNTSLVFGNAPIQYNFVLNSSGLPAQTGQSATFNNLAPGIYSVTLTLTSPGLPSCSITQQITLQALPTGGFTYTPNSQACSGTAIQLHINGYSPANTYLFEFAGTSFYATSQDPIITINTGGSHLIKLNATTPQGCTYSTTQPFGQIFISEPLFNGSLNQLSINVCEGNLIPSITFTPSFGSQTPSGYTWMNGNQPVAGAPNSPTFTPIESGNYWPILLDNLGCGDDVIAPNSVPVTIRKKPYVNIIGKANLCVGNSTTLYGVVTEPNMNYIWQHNGSTVASGTGTITPLVTGSLSVGTHTYTLMVTPPNDPTCGSSKDFVITVSNPPAQPSISMSIQCADPNVNPAVPYLVTLTANGPANGQYNWTNGMTGQSIQVSHGGIYGVRYTAPSGCSVDNQINVPPNLESLMWIFPIGCYDFCPRDGYIIGPRGDYNYHEWQYFGNAQQSGNGFIYPFSPGAAGNYQLMINDGTCSYTSGVMTYNPNPECGIEYSCKLGVHIERVRGEHSPYEVYGVIMNNGSQSVTLTLSSGNNSGIYYPSTITIAPGAVYDFTVNPILFYPAPGFAGGNDTMLITGINCEEKTDIEFPHVTNKGVMLVNTTKPIVTIAPNPAKHEVRVSYNTGNKERKASMILVHDAMGNVKYRQKLDAADGSVSFDTTPWLQGMYIVTIVTADKPIQAKLLKE